MRRASLLLVALAFTASPAFAQEEDIEFGNIDELAASRPPFIALDAVDPAGFSRFHLSTRAAFSDDADIVRESARWAFELSTALRLTEGLAIVATLPFGAYAPKPGVNEFFVGNFKLGVAGGFEVALPGDPRSRNRPRLAFGGGFDVYAPTAPPVAPEFADPLEALRDPVDAVADIRSYDPELYATRLMTFRPRVTGLFSINVFAAQVELGLAPAFTATNDSRFLMMFHWLVHLAVQPVTWFEPFLELGSTMQIVGVEPGADLTKPVQLTTGLRMHLGPISPAAFVAIDLSAGTPIVGVDLAGILYGQERGVARGEDPLDF